jgi:hypothetical protein
MSSQSRQPANIFNPAFWLIAGEDAVRQQASKTENNRACALVCAA